MAQGISQAEEWKKESLSQEGLSPAELKDKYKTLDFAPLWTETDNRSVLGFIGDNFLRIRVKMISITRDPSNPLVYSVSGKTKVKTNTCTFSGTITITNIRSREKAHYGVDDEYARKEIRDMGIAVAKYKFIEDPKQPGTGTFEGVVVTNWYIDKNGKLLYDDIMSLADGFSNNMYVGIWKSYKTGAEKKCNWGDYRIPFCGDLDQGAGEFSPMEKYYANGWQSYVDAYFKNNEQALALEKAEWWK